MLGENGASNLANFAAIDIGHYARKEQSGENKGIEALFRVCMGLAK